MRAGLWRGPALRRVRFAATCAAVLLSTIAGSSTPALARDGGDRDGEPRVARVAFVEGEASYLNGDAESWTPVDVNAPLVAGDRFYTGPDSKAEIQLDGGVYARLASETELDVLDLSTEAAQVRVGIGTALFRVRRPPADRWLEVATPGAAVVLRTRGLYRVDVDDDGHTTVVVRDGEADAYAGDERIRLTAGRGADFPPADDIVNADVPPADGFVQADFPPADGVVRADYAASGDGDLPPGVEVFDATGAELDAWDDWEASREARVARAASYQYVDDDVYGVEDLDDYGTWDRHAEYGPIWHPTQVSAGWAPYTEGRWVWQDPWGWTWVDYEPWGWAPSHYGRWVYVSDAWAWAPGPVVARPVYAPAVVGFVDVSTPSVSVSIGVGPSVGWVPLGWGEPIVPWWGGVGGVVVGRPWWGGWGGPRIVNDTVIHKEVSITNIHVNDIRYAHVGRPHALTAVGRDDFVHGRMRRLDVPHDRLRDMVRPVAGNPGIVPVRESLVAARPEKLRGGRSFAPPRQAVERAAVTSRTPRSLRAGFDRKRPVIERQQGAPVAPAELRRMASELGRSPVRAVASRGTRVVEPRHVAEVPRRQRGERPARLDAASPALERGQPARRAGLGRGDAPGRAGDLELRREPAERPAVIGAQDRRAGDGGSPRQALGRGRASDLARAPAPAPDAERAMRTVAPRREQAMRPQQRPDLPRRQREPAMRAGREQAASREQAMQQRQESQRRQREPAPRAQRQQAAAGQREQVVRQQHESQRQQRQAAMRAQEDAGRRQREQAMRQQQEAQRQRESAMRAQREQAMRQQQDARRQQQAMRQQQDAQRREQAMRQAQEPRVQQRQAVRAPRAAAGRAPEPRRAQRGESRDAAQEPRRGLGSRG